MNKSNLKLPKGFRDFTPQQMAKRNFLFEKIRRVFHLYGFNEIQTPAIENLSVLMEKYGEEAGQLIFKILNKKAEENLETNLGKNSENKTIELADKALRYDLTIPLTGYISRHKAETIFPFRRYQIQPVWRADKPQKGRFREFYQCDIDIIGAESLIAEVEIICIIYEVMNAFCLKNFTLRINHKDILAGLAECMGVSDQMHTLCNALDKADKIGLEKVFELLEKEWFSKEALQKLREILSIQLPYPETLGHCKHLLAQSPKALKALDTLWKLYIKFCSTEVKTENIKLDLSLVRGLNYYTGTLFELTLDDVDIPTIGGGGRYDQLIEDKQQNLSGLGFSFGLERIYEVMEEQNLFDKAILDSITQVMITYPEQEGDELKLSTLMIALRKNQIPTIIYPNPDKLSKQLSYAAKNKINWVVMVNREEESEFILRNLYVSAQSGYTRVELLKFLNKTCMKIC